LCFYSSPEQQALWRQSNKLLANFQLPDLQKLVDQMAATAIQDVQLTYGVITEDDKEKVLELLKHNFFKVKSFAFHLRQHSTWKSDK